MYDEDEMFNEEICKYCEEAWRKASNKSNEKYTKEVEK